MSSTSSSSDAPSDLPRPPLIDVDAQQVARGLDLELEAFRRLMDQGQIRTLSERGVGEDAGLFRMSFYWKDRRFRIVTDALGRVQSVEERDTSTRDKTCAKR